MGQRQMNKETETLYIAAMLELGPVPHLSEVLRVDTTGEPIAWERKFARSEFMNHKAKLLDWMYFHNVCGGAGVWILACHPRVLPHSDALLTKQAAYWVGGFYRWLTKQGEANADA